MTGAWIEAARQQLCVACNHGAVMSKVYHQNGLRCDPKNMEGLQTMREQHNVSDFGTVCRGSKLDAKRHSQLLEACGPSSSNTSESVRG
jgi:hypothetical protein